MASKSDAFMKKSAPAPGGGNPFAKGGMEEDEKKKKKKKELEMALAMAQKKGC